MQSSEHNYLGANQYHTDVESQGILGPDFSDIEKNMSDAEQFKDTWRHNNGARIDVKQALGILQPTQQPSKIGSVDQ